MSIGNLRDEGNQSKNFPWQLKMLLGQQCACDALQEIAGNTDEVESYLAQILAAIQSGEEYEAALVLDDNGVTWLEVRIFNSGTGTFDPPVYYQAGSNVPGTPAFPITYINPNAYLAQIVSNTTDIPTIATNTSSFSRTPGILSVSGAGATPAPVYSISIANVGAADGVINGVTLPAGVTVNFDGGGLNNTLSALSYNATGTTFIITYIS